MSHRTYNELWNEADRELEDLGFVKVQNAAVDLLSEDAPKPEPEAGPDPAKPEEAREHFGLLYIRFIQIFKKLATAYDQIVHPQKRRILRLLMEGTMGRLLELKHVLVQIELNHFTLLDDILADVKLTPDDIEIPTPAFFRRENLKQLKERERVLDDYDAQTLDPRLKDPEPEPEKMSLEQAIQIIQIHERARQGRLRAKFMQDIRAQEERERRARENPNHVKLKPDQAAIVLQKYIRGWAVRKRVWTEVKEDSLFIGMEMPDPPPKKKNPILKLQRAVETAMSLNNNTSKHIRLHSLISVRKFNRWKVRI